MLTADHFGQIDFVLVQCAWMNTISHVYSDMSLVLASHHFVVIADLQVAVSKNVQKHARQPHFCISGLHDEEIANRFAALFDDNMAGHEKHDNSPDALLHAISNAFRDAAESCLPRRAKVAKRPWISTNTLELLEKRDVARTRGDTTGERSLSKQIKHSVADDREIWLNQLLQSGDWGEIRKLRQKKSQNYGRLCNSKGDIVDSDMHAETLATYFESVQWAVRPLSGADVNTPIGPPLPVDEGRFTLAEVVEAASRLKRKKAPGADCMPAEFWRAICCTNSPACRWAVALCNKIWECWEVPASWHEALVMAFFKKGDTALCENYRPITVVSARYKLFAMILLKRLHIAGAEEGIWPTQFAFRS